MRWCLGGRDGDGGASWVVDGMGEIGWCGVVVLATKVVVAENRVLNWWTIGDKKRGAAS